MHDEKEEPKVEESEIIEFAKKEGFLEENADAMEASDESDAESGAESELAPDEQNQIMSSIEAILFMSDKPVSLARLRSLIGEEHKVAVYRNMMKKLREDFASEHRGVEISAVNHGFQLRTKPQMSAVLRKIVKPNQ